MASERLDTSPPDMRIIATNEKVTGPPATEMLIQSLCNTDEPLEVLDNACGGGVLAAEVYKLAKENSGSMKLKRIIAADIDEKMTKYVQKRSQDDAWQNIEVMKFDQQSVPLPDNSFTNVYNNFGIFFCQDDEKALAETFRITKPGGVVGFTSWKSITWWPTVAMPAVSAFIPDAPALPDPKTVFPVRGWSDPSAIPAKMEKAGFTNVKVSEYSFTPDVEAEEFAEAVAVLVKVITKRFWTEDQNQKFGDRIEPALLRYFQENYAGGKWNGKMVAIISTGRKG